jgi:hypothetical protein
LKCGKNGNVPPIISWVSNHDDYNKIDRAVNPNDRMWMAGAKLVDSVTASLDKLMNMTMKFKQEEEMKGMTLVDKESNTKEMTSAGWLEFIKMAKNMPDDEIGQIIENK